MFTTDEIIMRGPAVLFMSQLGEVLLDLMGEPTHGVHLTNGDHESKGRERDGSVRCSRITWLIALLYLSVTDSHAYFSVPKDFDCLHSCWGCNKWSRGQSGV